MGKAEPDAEMACEHPTDIDVAVKEVGSPDRWLPGATPPPKLFSRRLFGGLLVAGGVVSASPATDAWAAAPPAGVGLYGSGTLGAWTGMSERVSSPWTMQTVAAADGVLAFGDSIGMGTFNDLAARFRPSGTRLAMNVKSGRPTTPTVDILGKWATTYRLPRRILMAVGSNDIFNPSVFAVQINRVMTIAGLGVTVFWPEIHVSRWSQSAGIQVADQRNSGWLNIELYAAAAKHENLAIIHWESFLAQQPGRIGVYLSDGVHTTPLGTAARNALIIQRV